MDEETKALMWKLALVGTIGTAISIPLGIWAIRRWPDETWKVAALLTAVGFGVKELMLHEPAPTA